MPRAGDIEDAKRELALVLAAQEFLDVLAAVDAEKGDAAPTTPGPTSVFEGAKEVKSGQGFPVVEVIGRRTVYDTEAEQSKDAVHEVSIFWTHCGDDELTIGRHLERLVRATRDVFWNRSLSAIASFPVEVGTEEYSPLMPGESHPFVKASETVVRVRTIAV